MKARSLGAEQAKATTCPRCHGAWLGGHGDVHAPVVRRAPCGRLHRFGCDGQLVDECKHCQGGAGVKP